MIFVSFVSSDVKIKEFLENGVLNFEKILIKYFYILVS